MKVAVITSGRLPVPPVEGGAVENLIDFYLEENERTAQCEFTVFSVAPSPVPEITQQHTRYVFLNTRRWLSRFCARIYNRLHKPYYYEEQTAYFISRVLKRLKREQWDVVLLENRPCFAPEVRRVVGDNTRIIVHLHNELLSWDDPKIYESRNVIDRVICVSDYIRRTVAKIDDGLQAITVRNGIDVNRFQSAHAIERSSVGLEDDDYVVAFWGRLVEEKGVRELFKAFARIADTPGMKLMVIGSSFYNLSSTSTEFIEELKQICQPFKDKVIFTGYVEYDYIPGYAKCADLAVLPSIWSEPFGTTILEAMAAGLRVVTTQTGGTPEMIDDESDILLKIDDGLVDKLAESILRMKAMPHVRKGNVKSKQAYAKEFLDVILSND